MQRTVRTFTGIIVAAMVVIGVLAVAHAQQPPVERRVLLQRDLTIPGHQAVLVAVTIQAGGREGRHTHPGTGLVHVLEGALTLDHEARSRVTYKAGESFHVDAGIVHEGINQGTTPVKALATFIVEKGKPLTSQVP